MSEAFLRTDLRTVDSVQPPRGIQLPWRTNMIPFPRFAPFALLALAVLMSTAGCKSNPNANNGQNAADTGTQDASSTRASPTRAPVSPTDNSAQAAPPAPGPAPASAGAPQSAPPPADSGAYSDQ